MSARRRLLDSHDDDARRRPRSERLRARPPQADAGFEADKIWIISCWLRAARLMPPPLHDRFYTISPGDALRPQRRHFRRGLFSRAYISKVIARHSATTPPAFSPRCISVELTDMIAFFSDGRLTLLSLFATAFAGL